MDWRRAILRIGVILIFIPLLLGDSSGYYKYQSWPQEKVDYALRLMYKQAEQLGEIDFCFPKTYLKQIFESQKSSKASEDRFN